MFVFGMQMYKDRKSGAHQWQPGIRGSSGRCLEIEERGFGDFEDVAAKH
jgi:hypothetical protein